MRIGAAAAPGRARVRYSLPLHLVAAHRPALPAPAELFGIRRRIDHALRPLGGRLDGPGANQPLPALGNSWPRLRAGRLAAGRALVDAVALRTVARHQRGPQSVVALVEPAVISLPNQTN